VHVRPTQCNPRDVVFPKPLTHWAKEPPIIQRREIYFLVRWRRRECSVSSSVNFYLHIFRHLQAYTSLNDTSSCKQCAELIGSKRLGFHWMSCSTILHPTSPPPRVGVHAGKTGCLVEPNKRPKVQPGCLVGWGFAIHTQFQEPTKRPKVQSALLVGWRLEDAGEPPRNPRGRFEGAGDPQGNPLGGTSRVPGARRARIPARPQTVITPGKVRILKASFNFGKHES
jgi:hypothetical protein